MAGDSMPEDEYLSQETDVSELKKLLSQAMILNQKKNRLIRTLKGKLADWEESASRAGNRLCLWEGIGRWWWITPDLEDKLQEDEKEKIMYWLLTGQKVKWLTGEQDIGEMEIFGTHVMVYVQGESSLTGHSGKVLLVGKKYQNGELQLELLRYHPRQWAHIVVNALIFQIDSSRAKNSTV